MDWIELKRCSPDQVIAWADRQPWCRAMSECMQDSQWHSEGDVWTHTKMVIHELQSLESWNSLTDHDRTVLVFVALFHDIAKPITTEVDAETGRLRSPKHAVKGEFMARSILRELECDLQTREQIARLVRYHGRPAFLLERTEPIHEVVKLSWLFENRLLYFFALADSRGRDTDSMTRPEENLHYWKLLSEENACYQQPYPFVTDHARYQFFHQSQPNLHYIPHENFSCTVTLMCGLPGAGKNTWLQKHRGDIPTVSLDDLRDEFDVDPTDNQGQIAQVAKERCRSFLRKGESFAFNATNTLRQTRGRWLELFASYNACIEIVYIEPPLSKIIKQNKSRQERVPESVIHKLADKIEPPTHLECHKLIVSTGKET